jgi:hypothetical protein
METALPGQLVNKYRSLPKAKPYKRNPYLCEMFLQVP